MLNWFPDWYDGEILPPYIFYSQQHNLYYACYGGINTIGRRELPYDVSGPQQLYTHSHTPFTFGEYNGDDGPLTVWNLAGTSFDVTAHDGLLWLGDETLQKTGVFDETYPQGYEGAVTFERAEDGPILIGGIWYILSGSTLDRPLDVEVPSGTTYACYGSVYCFHEVTLETSFPGTMNSARPLSYWSKGNMMACADLNSNTWYVPIPFPKSTCDPKVTQNGFTVIEDIPRFSYDRGEQRWGGTFPMAHYVTKGIIRTDPLIVRLRKDYRMHYGN